MMSQEEIEKIKYPHYAAGKKKTEEVIYAKPPKHCDLCKHRLTNNFVDGRTRRGPWANMCWECYKVFGVGLGTGQGQQYMPRDDGSWVKVAG